MLHRLRAFTLIELALVLVIVSLMTGFGMQAADSVSLVNCEETTQRQLAQIDQALKNYAAKNLRLPRPALMSLGSNHADFGKERASAAPDTGTTLIGALPHTSLGLPASFAADCWGSKFTYAVSASQVSADPTTGYPSGAVGNIELLNGNDLKPEVSYVVLSHGQDKFGATSLTANDVVPTNCNSSTASKLDRDNCKLDDARFNYAMRNTGDTANYFDDMLVFSERRRSTEDCGDQIESWGPSNSCSAGSGSVIHGNPVILTDSTGPWVGSANATCDDNDIIITGAAGCCLVDMEPDNGSCCNPDTDGNGLCGFQCIPDGSSTNGNVALCCSGSDPDSNNVCGDQCVPAADGAAPAVPCGCQNPDTDSNGLCGNQCVPAANGAAPAVPCGCQNPDTDGNGLCGFQCIADGASHSGTVTNCCSGSDIDSNGLCGDQTPPCTPATDGSPPAACGCQNVDTDGNGLCGFQCIADGASHGGTVANCCSGSDIDSNGQCGDQTPTCTPVDGGFTVWSGWSACDASCQQSRTRSCTNPAPNACGAACAGPTTENQGCTGGACPPTCTPVDGGWTAWSGWSSCDASCNRTRTRSCTNPAPNACGATCAGSATDTESCSGGACPPTCTPVDGGFTAWSGWSACDASCSQSRTRSCTNPAPNACGAACAGVTTENQGCTGGACPPTCTPVDGGYGAWGAWSACSGGMQSRNRNCDSPAPSCGGAACVGPATESQCCPTDGGWSGWSAWSAWSACSSGSQSRTRTRTCTNPAPSCGGAACTGPATETDTQCCPTDGGWTAWSGWSACSGGNQTRTRTCTAPAPSCGGASCTGSATDSQCCPTDGGWTAWSAWSACDGTQQTRTRSCTNPAPACGGVACVGSTTETQGCCLPTAGGWSGWSAWGACDGTQQTRTRSCTNPAPACGGAACIGSTTETQGCCLPTAGGWSGWSAWGACDATCNQTRTRNCDSPAASCGGAACSGSATQSQPCTGGACPPTCTPCATYAGSEDDLYGTGNNFVGCWNYTESDCSTETDLAPCDGTTSSPPSGWSACGGCTGDGSPPGGGGCCSPDTDGNGLCGTQTPTCASENLNEGEGNFNAATCTLTSCCGGAIVTSNPSPCPAAGYSAGPGNCGPPPAGQSCCFTSGTLHPSIQIYSGPSSDCTTMAVDNCFTGTGHYEVCGSGVAPCPPAGDPPGTIVGTFSGDLVCFNGLWGANYNCNCTGAYASCASGTGHMDFFSETSGCPSPIPDCENGDTLNVFSCLEGCHCVCD